MKIFAFALVVVLFAVIGSLNTGCYARMNGRGAIVAAGVHEARWHYDNDYDENWRHNHPYYQWDYDTNHDEQWRHDHPWHE